MSLDSAAITTAIAAMSVSGVTIKDTDEIPSIIYDRDCPMLFPAPGDWIDGSSAAVDDETTFGTATSRMWVVHRTFHYIYIHSEVNSARGYYEVYGNAADDIENIAVALMQLDISNVDVESVSHNKIGTMKSPNEKSFVGCDFNITFRERINP